jgi:hypothetical protein
VDLLLGEIEDVITDGFGAKRQFPYAHLISYICARIAPSDSPHAALYESLDVPRFSHYRPTRLDDPRRGRHLMRQAMERLALEVRERVEEEEEALLEAETQLPSVVWSASDSDDEDEDFFPHDFEAKGQEQHQRTHQRHLSQCQRLQFLRLR